MTREEIISAIYKRLDASGFFGKFPLETIDLLKPEKDYQLNIKVTMLESNGRLIGETARLKIEATKSGSVVFKLIHNGRMMEIKFSHNMDFYTFDLFAGMFKNFIKVAMDYHCGCSNCDCEDKGG